MIDKNISFFLIIPLFVLFGSAALNADEKVIIGGIEEVSLLPWGIKIPARIDTGAATSSLDVKEIKLLGEKSIEIILSDKAGGVKINLPVVAWRYIKSSDGRGYRRPVVEIEICLGHKRIRTQFTLNDRSSMKYPLLIGRRTLKGNFIVDVNLSNTITPECSDVNLQ